VHYPATDLVADGTHCIKAVSAVFEQDSAREAGTGVVNAD
jgi:hypothetical protein